jgi:hypothetical protein
MRMLYKSERRGLGDENVVHTKMRREGGEMGFTWVGGEDGGLIMLYKSERRE